MTTTKTDKESRRIAAIDTLRGIAIFGMILCANIGWHSGLPAWMFHAQVPPPDYIFNPDVRGITWVDLVFPFFLFSMGAAFPFAMTKRLGSGQSVPGICLGLIKRWLILAVFSIILGNCYQIRGSGAGNFLPCIFMAVSWCAMFLSLCRFRFKKESYNHMANAAGAIMLAALTFAMEPVLGIHVSKERSDIIIMVLAYMALCGGFIWIVSRKSHLTRWGIFAAILAIKAMSSYCPEILSFLPSPESIGLGWIFSWKFLQYLLIAIPGSIAGDMILEKISDTGDRKSGKADAWLACMAMLTVIFQLWALFTRHVYTDIAVTAISGTAFILLTYRKKKLWSGIMTLGYLLMTAGTIFDPIDGGIRKDYCNISYLLTTAGMAAVTTGFLVFLEMRYGMKARLLSECGQNPMIAYTVTNFITIPLLAASELLPAIEDCVSGSPVMGILRGLVITGIMMAITVFFTRKKIYWRS